MAKPIVRGRRFGKETVLLDGMHYVDCSFEGTQLLYFGGAVPKLDGCRMTDVAFGFKGPAKNTMDFVKLLIGNGMLKAL